MSIGNRMTVEWRAAAARDSKDKAAAIAVMRHIAAPQQYKCPHCGAMHVDASRVPECVRLDELLKRAAKHVMTPAEARAQKLSFIRGQTGQSTEAILKVLPELGEVT